MNPEEYTIQEFLNEDPERSIGQFAELIKKAQFGIRANMQSVIWVMGEFKALYDEYHGRLEEVRQDYLYSGGDEKKRSGSLI